MSAEQDQIRSLAERIARRLASADKDEDAGRAQGAGDAELLALREKLSDVQRRLAHIESHLTHGESCAHEQAGGEEARRQPSGPAGEPRAVQDATGRLAGQQWLSGTYVPVVAHPSEERFHSIDEAVAELVDYFESEKTCSLEPGAKPCDHCGMCNSRGF